MTAYVLMDFSETPPLFGRAVGMMMWTWTEDPNDATRLKSMKDAEAALDMVRAVYPITSTQVSIQQVV